MFDIGFSELVLIFIVGLIVLGPKRLPIAIRTVMGWVATVRAMAANVQGELAKELKLQELQESIKKAEALNLSQFSPELSKTVEDLKQSAEQMQNELNNAKKLTEEQVVQIQQKIEQESQTLQMQAVENEQSFATQPTLNEAMSEEHVELAEEAEFDESAVSAYYTDDALADEHLTQNVDSATEKGAKDVS